MANSLEINILVWVPCKATILNPNKLAQLINHFPSNIYNPNFKPEGKLTEVNLCVVYPDPLEPLSLITSHLATTETLLGSGRK